MSQNVWRPHLNQYRHNSQAIIINSRNKWLKKLKKNQNNLHYNHQDSKNQNYPKNQIIKSRNSSLRNHKLDKCYLKLKISHHKLVIISSCSKIVENHHNSKKHKSKNKKNVNHSDNHRIEVLHQNNPIKSKSLSFNLAMMSSHFHH